MKISLLWLFLLKRFEGNFRIGGLILLVYLTFSSTILFSKEKTEFTDTLGKCGEYKISGVVRLSENHPTIVVHEDTQSEIKITLPLLNEVQLSSFLNNPIDVTIILTKEMDGFTNAKAFSVTQEPTFRVPNPLNQLDTGFKLIKQSRCEEKRN